MSLLSLTNPPGWSVCSALCILIVLLPEAKADNLNNTTERNGGGTQCGEYTNQVITVNILNTRQSDVFWTSCCRRDFSLLAPVSSVYSRDVSALWKSVSALQESEKCFIFNTYKFLFVNVVLCQKYIIKHTRQQWWEKYSDPLLK